MPLKKENKAMAWTHASLEPKEKAEYSTTPAGYILRGQIMIGLMLPARKGGFDVYVPGSNARHIGKASSRAEAMLMAIHNHERPR